MHHVEAALADHLETHTGGSGSHLNRLRAAVLGANDGIVSVAGLVVGVAGATASHAVIFASGMAGLVAGALSMAVGEYVSVSSQRDTERAILEKERAELAEFPEREALELAHLYEKRGLSKETARLVAHELTEHDAFAAHADAELGIDPDDLTDPWHAAIASAAAFLVGALIPVIAILLPPADLRIPVTVVSVIVALTLTGVLSARSGGAHVGRATFRVVFGGAIAMAVTYGIGRLFGVNV